MEYPSPSTLKHPAIVLTQWTILRASGFVFSMFTLEGGCGDDAKSDGMHISMGNIIGRETRKSHDGPDFPTGVSENSIWNRLPGPFMNMVGDHCLHRLDRFKQFQAAY